MKLLILALLFLASCSTMHIMRNSANAIAVTHGGSTTAVFSLSTNITTSGAASDSFADVICIGSR